MIRCLRLVVVLLLVSPAHPQEQPAAVQPLEIGIIGLDTSHVVAFTKLFNDPEAQGDLALMRVVAGYPGGTDIPASRDRVQGFTRQLEGMGIVA